MEYKAVWDSPLGALTVTGNDTAITGLWMEGQRYFGAGLTENAPDGTDLPMFRNAKAGLDAYFRGDNPDFSLISLSPNGTPFQEAVWAILRQIPYGETTTYGEIAAMLEAISGRKTSARAVGSAVGRNPISIFIPCHRVMGAGGKLTGYAGGLARKEFLLSLERKSELLP